MATFNETRALISKKYIVEQGINISKVLQKQIASVALLRFCFRIIASKMLYLSFLSLKKTLVATFNETCTVISRKYVFEEGMNVLKSSEKHKLLWSHFYVFALQ